MWVLMNDATGVKYFLQKVETYTGPEDGIVTEYRMNGLIENAMQFHTEKGAIKVCQVLSLQSGHSLRPMEFKK